MELGYYIQYYASAPRILRLAHCWLQSPPASIACCLPVLTGNDMNSPPHPLSKPLLYLMLFVKGVQSKFNEWRIHKIFLVRILSLRIWCSPILYEEESEWAQINLNYWHQSNSELWGQETPLLFSSWSWTTLLTIQCSRLCITEFLIPYFGLSLDTTFP